MVEILTMFVKVSKLRKRKKNGETDAHVELFVISRIDYFFVFPLMSETYDALCGVGGHEKRQPISERGFPPSTLD